MSFVEIDARTRAHEWSMSGLQSHDYFEIYLLLEGSRRLFIDGKSFAVSAPTACVIPPYCMHKTEGEAYRRININVSPDALRERERELLYRLSKTAVFGFDPQKAAFFIDFLEHAASLSASRAADGDLTLALVKVTLALLDEAHLTPCATEESPRTSRTDLAVIQATAYVKEHFDKDFSLDELCDTLFISKNSLCSRFKAFMNCSVMEYRSFLRIARAKELLVSTNLSLGKIAEACGYSSANYFSLIFKKEVGISPMNYRKAK